VCIGLRRRPAAQRSRNACCWTTCLSAVQSVYARAASVRAAFCLKFAKLEMARAKTHAKRVQNRGIGGSGLVRLRGAPDAGREVSGGKKKEGVRPHSRLRWCRNSMFIAVLWVAA
jgi:hypothetical protein